MGAVHGAVCGRAGGDLAVSVVGVQTGPVPEEKRERFSPCSDGPVMVTESPLAWR